MRLKLGKQAAERPAARLGVAHQRLKRLNAPQGAGGMLLAAASRRGGESLWGPPKRFFQPEIKVSWKMGRIAGDGQDVCGPEARAMGETAGRARQGAFDVRMVKEQLNRGKAISLPPFAD
ncbi:MAG: hypothetical protein Q8J81_03130 [Phenylobacterium sp.]|nr:hypothetical protein [Phenylobacterium sp.]